MITYKYTIEDKNNAGFVVLTKVEYDENNAYNTNYYFYNGEVWHKDFIDLENLSPKDKENKEYFSKFVNRLHDYMVHGNLWKDIKEMNDDEVFIKDQYDLKITSEKL